MSGPWLGMICAVSVALGAGTASANTPKLPATTEGRLVTKDKANVVDVPLEHTDVRIRIDGLVAETTVTQRFANPYTTKIEAVYLFPLPTSAAVGDLTIKTGGRTIRGTLQERGKAKQVYEAARRQGLVAALLTEERPNLFTQHVANLEPGASIEVALSYAQRLEHEHAADRDGGYSLAFPMVAGPRYMPSSAKAKPTDTVTPAVLPAGLRPAHDISLRVEIDAGVAIEGIASTSHQIAIDRPGPARAVVRIQPGDTIPNKDFTLRYQVAGEAPKFGVLGHRAGVTGSFLFVAQPPATAKPAHVAPREIVFVLDTSSSMRGAPLAKAKELIRRVLWTLRTDDTFQIVRFADRSSSLGPGPIAAKPKNIELTLAWLGKLEAGGGTEMATGIDAALAVPHDPLRLRILAFITDGYVGNEDEIIANVGKRIGASRLFSFGVGSAVNRYLLEEMASIGRGAVQFVRPDEDTAKAVAAFERRIATPVLTDIRLDWGKLAVRDVVPAAIPDLFVGQPLVLSGHYTGGGTGTVTVRAKQAGRDVSFEVPVALPDKHERPAIAAVWARARIAELSRKLLRKADETAVKEIVALSLEHRVLTQYTAFVAVDESRVTGGGDAKRIVVPVHIPDAVRGMAGGDYEGYGYGVVGNAGGGSGVGYGHGIAAPLPPPQPPHNGKAYDSGWGYSPTDPKIASKHPVSPPTVTIPAPARVEGALDSATIKRNVARVQPQIRYCYEKALLRNPNLAGTVTTQFTISPTGAVIAASAGGLGDKEVEACIAAVIQRIEFPKVDGGSQIKVNYPFVLKPGTTGTAHDVVKEMLK